MTGRHLSPEAREQVVTLTVAGYTAPRIASFLGVCVRTVQRIRIQEGVAQPAPIPLTEDEKRLAGRLLDDGASYQETARTIGRSVRQLRKHFPGRGWTREQCIEFMSIRCRNWDIYREVSGRPLVEKPFERYQPYWVGAPYDPIEAGAM